VGWLAKRKARREADAAREAYEAALRRWTAVDAVLAELLEEAKTFDGTTQADTAGLVLELKEGEHAFLVLEGCGLVETRRGQGHYQGGYSGFSIPVGDTGIRYRIGASRGTYVPGPEHPTVIDTGVATITDQRAVFQGPQQSREWTFAKLLGFQHFDAPSWTAIQVSNRQKTSGISYATGMASRVQFRLELAIAHFEGDLQRFVANLEAEANRHHLARPAPPGVTAGPAAGG
jgi:hypothetical protein